MKARSLLNTFTNTLAVLLAPLTFSILISWNALPGDRLYPLKRTLENAAVILVSPSYAAQSTLQLKLIDRRLNESNHTIIAKHSSAGVIELRTQIHSAQKSIVESKKADPKQAAQFKEKLQQTKQELELQKQTVAQSSPEQNTQTPTNYPTRTPPTTTPTKAYSPPTATPTQAYAPPTSTPTPTAKPTPKKEVKPQKDKEVIKTIQETQDDIDQIIKKLDKIQQEKSKNNSSNKNNQAPDRSDQAPDQHRQDKNNPNN